MRQGGAPLAAVLAVALVARAALVLATPDYEPLFDSADYARHAVSIAGGHGFPDTVFAAGGGPSAFRPPLYPYLLGAVYAISGNSETAGRLLGVVLGVLVVLLVYLVAARLWDHRSGLIAAALAALAPPLVFLSGPLGTEPLFLVLVLAAVLLALHSRDRHGDVRFAAAAGVMCGLGALTRSNGLLLAIPIALGVMVARPLLSRRALLAAAAVAVGAVIAVVPWAVRNALTFDGSVALTTQTGFALAGQYNDQAMNFPGYRGTWILPSTTPRYKPLYERDDLDEAQLDEELRRLAVDYARDHPRYALGSTLRNTGRTLELVPSAPVVVQANRQQLDLSKTEAAVERFSFYAMALIALASAVLLVRDRRTPVFVWVVPLLLFVAAQPLLATTRYRAPLYPFLALAAAPALALAADRVRARRSSAPAR